MPLHTKASRDYVGEGERARGPEMVAYLRGNLIPAAVEAPRWSGKVERHHKAPQTVKQVQNRCC